MFDEEDLLPLSGLQHLAFCERQWALIHLEQFWEENRLTSEGRILHERVHETETESRPGLIIARGLRIQSRRLGLAGQADAVEFYKETGAGVALPDREGHWRPFPVEYKRGRPKADSCDEVQLCAQAMCLEEMFGVVIESGALYYGKPRRRSEVPFVDELRAQTIEMAGRMHDLYRTRLTPQAVYAKKCENCSLYDRCLPRAISRGTTVERYLARALQDDSPAK